MTADDITWTTTTADQGSGDTVTVADAGEENPAHPRVVENRTAYGHGGVIPKGTDLAIVRADDGGVGVAIHTARPSWASEVGDTYMVAAAGHGLVFGLRGGGKHCIVEGCDDIYLGETATQGVIIDGDPAPKTTGMATWMAQVEFAINGLVPGSVAPLSTAIPYIAQCVVDPLMPRKTKAT